MTYYRLHIDSKNDVIIYNKITDILNVTPTIFKLDNAKNREDKYSLWTYTIDVDDDEPYYDFINNFLDIIEPKFDELEKIKIKKDDITFWMNYEYEEQCGMEFHPQEMERLGKSGIVLAIDCWKKKSELTL